MARVFYLVQNIKEQKELEDAVDKLLSQYEIFIKGDIQVSYGFDKCIRIHPLDDQIRELKRVKEDKSPASLERLTIAHSFARVKIDDRVYQINFNPSVKA